MKRTFITILAAAAVLAGCNKDKNESSAGIGTLRLTSLQPQTELNDKDINAGGKGADTKALPSELTDVSDFNVTIANSLSGGLNQTYKYSDIADQALELPTGTYTITAKSSDTASAAWDQPIFEGTKEFTIVEGAITPVEVKCYLTNVVVSVSLTDTFLTELSAFNIKVTGGDGNFLTWTTDDYSRDGYFDVADLTVYIDGTRSLDNSTATLSAKITDVKAKDHIILNIDAKLTGETSKIALTVDGSVNERAEDIYVDGFEEVEIADPTDPTDPDDPDTPVTTPDAPTLEWAANPTFGTMTLAEEMDVNLTVKAPGKIKTFVVAVDSDILGEILPGMTGDKSCNLDLINDDTFIAYASNLGLKSGDEIKGQTEVEFDLSSLVPMIYNLSPASGTEHKFTLNLTDEYDQALSKTLTFVMP